ncbi:unnamed protein product [Cyprideis torosa]|uniref:Uncharacterized protein n=1 Tax=Cyprideis torosa TaxID=163714 RepID=A0A7R8W1T4_9CRUS|nr:unnamed protein product [Cyprideis torosa]CAG0881296.1 unnamed protein product [Cyprideis torosa]
MKGVLVKKPRGSTSEEGAGRCTPVTEDEWTTLQKFYTVDLDLQVENLQIEESKSIRLFTPEICETCSREHQEEAERKVYTYRNQRIFVRKVTEPPAGGASSSSETTGEANGVGDKDEDKDDADSDGEISAKRPSESSSTATPMAESVSTFSKRARLQRGEKGVMVSSDMTVKDLKKKLLQYFSVIPSDQELAYGERTLSNDTATLAEEKILPGARLTLKFAYGTLYSVASTRRVQFLERKPPPPVQLLNFGLLLYLQVAEYVENQKDVSSNNVERGFFVLLLAGEGGAGESAENQIDGDTSEVKKGGEEWGSLHSPLETERALLSSSSQRVCSLCVVVPPALVAVSMNSGGGLQMALPASTSSARVEESICRDHEGLMTGRKEEPILLFGIKMQTVVKEKDNSAICPPSSIAGGTPFHKFGKSEFDEHRENGALNYAIPSKRATDTATRFRVYCCHLWFPWRPRQATAPITEGFLRPPRPPPSAAAWMGCPSNPQGPSPPCPLPMGSSSAMYDQYFPHVRKEEVEAAWLGFFLPLKKIDERVYTENDIRL